MSLFPCSQCGYVDNTALTNFWTRNAPWNKPEGEPNRPALCSLCDPEIGKWHGRFDRVKYDPKEHGEVNEQGYCKTEGK